MNLSMWRIRKYSNFKNHIESMVITSLAQQKTLRLRFLHRKETMLSRNREIKYEYAGGIKGVKCKCAMKWS